MNAREVSAENNEWQKSGDFAAVMRAYQSGGRMGEKVVYTHQKTDAALKEIQVCCEHPGELRVWLKINPDKYDEVEHHLAASGFPMDYLQTRYLDMYQTQAPNAEYLANFLHALNNYDHGIDNICREIINNVSPSMNNEPTIHGWVKHGSVMNHPYETYLSCSDDSKIKRITIERSTAEDTHLIVEVKNNAFNWVENKVQEQGFRSTFSSAQTFLTRLSYPIRSKDQLEKTLQALATAENSVAAMSDSLIDSYSHMKPFKPNSNDFNFRPIMRMDHPMMPPFYKPFYWPTKPVPPKLSEKDLKKIDDLISKLQSQDEAGKINLNQPTPRASSNIFGKSSLFATSIHEEPTIDPTPSDDDLFKFPTIRHY